MTREAITSFNLVEEPWIEVRTFEGNTVSLSLLEVFRQAQTIKCLANNLPTQDFAILRVLLAILQRSMVGCWDDYEYPSDAWGDLWHSGMLPVERIEAYLHQWQSRFDLFDDECPFMQVAGLEAQNGKTKDIRALIGISENKPQLFTERTLGGLESLSFSEAARWLIHAHSFDVAGIKTGVVGDPAVKAGKSSPQGTGWAGCLGGYYLEGASLAETLMLNLILSADCADGVDDWFSEDDIPVWEQPQKMPGDEGRSPRGRADVFTWQSRRIRLIAEEGRVVGVILTNGDRLESSNRNACEPMTSWRRSPTMEKKLHVTPVYRPILHQSNRAIWRGLTSLLPRTEGEDNAYETPGVVAWAGFLTDANGGEQLERDYPLHVHAVGFEYGTQNAIIKEMIDDTMVVEAFLVSSEGQVAAATAKRCMLNTSESVERVLARLARQLKLAAGEDKELVGETAEKTKAEAYFEIDSAFRTWLSSLDVETDCAQAEIRWNRQVSSILRSIARQLIEGAGPDAIVGRRVKLGRGEEWVSAGKAERDFEYWLNKTLPQDTSLGEARKGDE